MLTEILDQLNEKYIDELAKSVTGSMDAQNKALIRVIENFIEKTKPDSILLNNDEAEYKWNISTYKISLTNIVDNINKILKTDESKHLGKILVRDLNVDGKDYRIEHSYCYLKKPEETSNTNECVTQRIPFLWNGCIIRDKNCISPFIRMDLYDEELSNYVKNLFEERNVKYNPYRQPLTLKISIVTKISSEETLNKIKSLI